MSEENVEAIRAGVEAVNRGDIEAVIDFVHPEIEWQTELIGTPTYRGREGVRQGLRDVTTAWGSSFHMEPVELIEGKSDRVFMAVHVTAEGKTTGARVEADFFYVFDFRDGKVVLFRGFTQISDALEAAGLSE